MSARSVRAKFFLTGFFRCRGDDLWPLKCGKGRATFSVFELDNGGAWLLPFQRAQRALRLAGPPCGCVSNHSEHPERLPSRRVVEAAGGGGEENRSQSRVSDAGRVPPRPWMTCAHKQRRRGRRSRDVMVSAPRLTPDDSRGVPRKQINRLFPFFSPSFLRKHWAVLIQQRRPCCEAERTDEWWADTGRPRTPRQSDRDKWGEEEEEEEARP